MGWFGWRVNLKEQKPFYLNRWFLKIAGIWPSEKETSVFYKLMSKSFLLCIGFFVMCEIAGNFSATRKDISRNLNIHIIHILAAMKAFFWQFRGTKVREVIEILDNPPHQYEDLGEFKPSEILKKSNALGIRQSLWFLYIVHACLIFYHMFNLYFGIFGEINENTPLPLLAWIPFQYNKNNTMYIFVVLYELFFATLICDVIVANDTTFMNILNNVVCQLAVVGAAFKTIRQRVVLISKNDENVNELTYKELVKCVQHLQMIFWVVNHAETIYSNLILFQGIFSLGSFTFTFLKLAFMPLKDPDYSTTLVLLIAATTQLQLYCWFGDNVYKEASNITLCIYESRWVDCDEKIKKALLITMIRMSRPLWFTYGKFFPLTFQSFVYIIKTAYSFYALLQTNIDIKF